MLVPKAACLFGAVLLIAGTASSLLQQALAQPQPAAAPSVGGQSAGMPEPLTVSTASLAQEAASAALLRFGPAITASNDERLGFSSPSELSLATIGSPIQTAVVPLDRLAGYNVGEPATSVILPGGALIVPVLVGNSVRCSVLVGPNGSAWTGVSLGQPNMTKLITTALQNVAKERNAPPASLVVLKIPALFLTFIARPAGAEIWLTPVSDNTTFDLHAGQELGAEAVFARLLPAARNYHPSGFVPH